MTSWLQTPVGFGVGHVVMLQLLASVTEANAGPFGPSLPGDWGNAKEVGLLEMRFQALPTGGVDLYV